MDSGTAAIIGALIGAMVVLVGGYIGRQLQARNTLAQWRRDKLFQLSTDFLAAATKMMDVAGQRPVDKSASVPFPDEVADHFSNVRLGIQLLSDELGGSAYQCEMAVLAMSLEEDEGFRLATTAAAESLRNFFDDAHEVLYDNKPKSALDAERSRSMRRWVDAKAQQVSEQRHTTSPALVSDVTKAMEKPIDHTDTPSQAS